MNVPRRVAHGGRNASKPLRAFVACLILLATPAMSSAGFLSRLFPKDLEKLNRKLCGRILDFTHNHGKDHRNWSPSVCGQRDLYVYLPPGYDGIKKFPLLIWLHGFSQDEETFLQFAPMFDRAIVNGKFPPVILAVPDGSIRERPTPFNAGSFYLNSKAGRFEDLIMNDVWEFLFANFAIRPERQSHAFVGASMGGFSAFNLGIKHHERVGVVAGLLPLLNLRYADCLGRRFHDFDPACQGWVEKYRPLSYSGKIMHFIPVLTGRAMRPLANRNEMRDYIASENPIEMLNCYDIKPGDLTMWVGYGTRDDFNVDAQVEGFIWHAQQRGVHVDSSVICNGRHDRITAQKLFPMLSEWLGARLGPYAPCCYPTVPITAPPEPAAKSADTNQPVPQ